MKQRRTYRRWLAVALALAAVAAPSAQAVTSAEVEAANWAGVLGVEPTVVGPEFPIWTVNFAQPENVGPEFPTYTINWARPQVAGPEFPTWPANWAQPVADAPPTPISTPSFDYRDAGIGAAIALGASLLAAAAVLGIRRNRGAATLL